MSERKEHPTLGYAGGCHLGPIGCCRFCGRELRELCGPSGYRLWYTEGWIRHPKRGCNVLSPIWFCWRVWEIVIEKG